MDIVDYFLKEKDTFAFMSATNNKNVHNLHIMSELDSNILRFTIAIVTEFARFYGITQKQAYNYLVRFQGMAHLNEFYDVLHTQSLEDNVEVLTDVCQHNGGQLR